MNHQRTSSPAIELSLRASPEFLDVATSASESGGIALGLGEPEALSLRLATEEIFSFLSGRIRGAEDIKIRFSGSPFGVEEEISFEARDLPLKVFNLTARASLETGGGEELGLLIASRVVDRFRFRRKGSVLQIILTKEKSYPKALESGVADPEPSGKFDVGAPNLQEAKIAVYLTLRHCPGHIPESFQYPGKVVDMLSAGVLNAAVAAVPRGGPMGAIFWQRRTPGLVEFFGPYIFVPGDRADVSTRLLDACLNALARTGTAGLFTRVAAPGLLEGYFEQLGTLFYRTPSDGIVENAVLYRHMEEDLGAPVFAPSVLEDFLKREYDRLAFVRDLLPLRDDGEWAAESSVLFTQIDRLMGQAILEPVWWGRDALAVLQQHVAALESDGLTVNQFWMDLGKPWQGFFAEPLVAAGFAPRLILPYAGKGDVVVFEYRHGAGP